MTGLLRMGWHDALFLHWPVDPLTLAARLPAGIEPRTQEGQGWLGVLAFVMDSIRPRGVPRFAGLTFGEANLRTYVRGPDGGTGIYFFNLDAADPLGVWAARRFYRLPYYRATMRIDRSAVDDKPRSRRERARKNRTNRPPQQVQFASNRIHPGVPDAHLDVGYEPTGEQFVAEPGSLEAFLVENYRFYLASGDVAGGETGAAANRLYAGDVVHDPWPLYRASLNLRSTNFLTVNGFERPDETPLAHYSPGTEVTAGPIRRVV